MSKEKQRTTMPLDEVSRLIVVSQELISKAVKSKNIRLHEDALIIQLALLAGLLNMEIKNLKKEDCLVGHQKKYIHIQKGKMGKSRYVEIPNTLINDIRGFFVFLNNIGKSNISPYLIRSERGENLTVHGLWRRWNKYTDYTMQSARGAYGRYLFETTCDSQFIKKQMGLTRAGTVFYYQSEKHNGINRKSLKDLELVLGGKNKTPEKSPPIKQDEPNKSFVYVIESNGIYKIGCTKNVSQRIKIIQTSCPFPIKPLLVINGDETTEKDLHLQFQNKQTHGEWFALNTKDVICISKKYSNEIEWMSAV
jgi:hypothetical protein